MSKRHAACIGLGWALSVLACPVILAQSVIRQGTELQVNSFTFNNQFSPAVASGGDGDFVVIWSSTGQDGAQYGLFARRFSSAGTPQGNEFQISSYTTNIQNRSAVAAETDGDFVVAWQSLTQDGSGYGVFARRFASNGTALGTEFQVNSYTSYYQWRATVASDSDGDFVVAWESKGGQDGAGEGIFARRFNTAGVALAVEFQVNAFTPFQQYRPAVALDGDGDFVIAWDAHNTHDGEGSGVFAQRFNSAGVAQGSEFQVNTYTTSNQYRSTVAADVNGNFVVAWQSLHQDGAFPDGNLGIFARRFNSTGAALATEFQINLYTPDYQRFPKIASDDSGDFVVTWESRFQDGSYESVWARRYSASGAAVGGEFQVNSFTFSGQLDQAIDWDSDGDFVIAWYNEEAQDGNGTGVFAQRFSLPPLATLDIDGNGTIGPLTDGLLVLRHLFGFTDASLTTGATAMNCTRCTAGEIQTYIDGLGMTLDIADNLDLDPLTDGLLVLRFTFGFTGATLTNGAVGACDERCDASTILPYLQTLD